MRSCQPDQYEHRHQGVTRANQDPCCRTNPVLGRQATPRAGLPCRRVTRATGHGPNIQMAASAAGGRCGGSLRVHHRSSPARALPSWQEAPPPMDDRFSVWPRMDSPMRRGRPGEKNPCPMPGTASSRACVICAARAWPCASGRSGSAVPWMTSVGAVIFDSGSSVKAAKLIAPD